MGESARKRNCVAPEIPKPKTVEEVKEEEEEKEKESSDEDDELLVKTGVSTVSISNEDLPSLEKKKVPKRIRISVSAW